MTATVTGKRGDQYLVDLGDGTGSGPSPKRRLVIAPHTAGCDGTVAVCSLLLTGVSDKTP